MRREERIHGFVETMWQWYAAYKRDLPWRDLTIEDDNQRAYCILVSEVMLQQTQVERVKIKYQEFLAQFPTLRALANASNWEVLIAWRGMGYNARALRLRDAARVIHGDFNGAFPREISQLQSIKGIGAYTAAAIRNFAFNIPTPCLDTNIRRILHRVFVGPENVDGTWRKDDRYLLRLAEEVLVVAIKPPPPSPPPERGRGEGEGASRTTAEWHAALMDFGSLVCTKMHPKWEICPLTERGLMKAAYRVQKQEPGTRSQEPGREVQGTFIPNRIFRGRIVEELRNAPSGLSLDELGKCVCADWFTKQHRAWLEELLFALKRDQLIQKNQKRYTLKV